MSAYMVDTDTVAAMVAAGLGHTEPGLVGNAAANPLRWWTTSMHCVREQLAGGDRFDQFRRELRPGQATLVGRMLLEENLRSLQARYDDHTEESDYVTGIRGTIEEWEYPAGGWIYQLTAGDVLGCIACYKYQACEASDWEDTEAHSFCLNLRHQIVEKLPLGDRPWGFNHGELRKRRTGARNLSSMLGG